MAGCWRNGPAKVWHGLAVNLPAHWYETHYSRMACTVGVLAPTHTARANTNFGFGAGPRVIRKVAVWLHARQLLIGRGVSIPQLGYKLKLDSLKSMAYVNGMIVSTFSIRWYYQKCTFYFVFITLFITILLA